MTKTPRTTAERSATAKAAYARRQADAAIGIPSIASLAASLYGFECATKAAARREAVRRIEAMRAEAAIKADRVEAAARAPQAQHPAPGRHSPRHPASRREALEGARRGPGRGREPARRHGGRRRRRAGSRGHRLLLGHRGGPAMALARR